MPETETTPEINTTDDATVEDGAATSAETKDAPDDAGALGEAGTKAIASEREARKAAEKQLRDAQKALKEYEDRDKSELQKAVERAEDAEQRAIAAEFNSMRNKVAAAKGVPPTSLTGTTEEELNASADELIAWRDQNAANKQPNTPKRNPALGGGLKSGATGNQNTNSDPKVAAAEAMRRLRAGG